MKLLIIQTSLNKNSKTNIAARETFKIGKEQGVDLEFLDLRDYDLQMCNGTKIETYNSDMNIIKDKVEAADAYILAYPVYNYSLSGVCKNFIDIFSYYMNGKKCGIIHNSYSERSFSDGSGELFKILGLHDNIDIVLPMIHTCNADFEDDTLKGEKAIEKIHALINKVY